MGSVGFKAGRGMGKWEVTGVTEAASSRVAR